MNNLLIVPILVLLSGEAYTQTRTVTGYGAGNASCGLWIEARRDNSEGIMIGWMEGNVSAAARYGGYTFKDTDRYAMATWMDNYCQKNPLVKFREGVHQMISTLKEK